MLFIHAQTTPTKLGASCHQELPQVTALTQPKPSSLLCPTMADLGGFTALLATILLGIGPATSPAKTPALAGGENFKPSGGNASSTGSGGIRSPNTRHQQPNWDLLLRQKHYPERILANTQSCTCVTTSRTHALTHLAGLAGEHNTCIYTQYMQTNTHVQPSFKSCNDHTHCISSP